MSTADTKQDEITDWRGLSSILHAAKSEMFRTNTLSGESLDPARVRYKTSNPQHPWDGAARGILAHIACGLPATSLIRAIARMTPARTGTGQLGWEPRLSRGKEIMLNLSHFWQKVSAGIAGTVVVCALASGECSAKDYGDTSPGSRQIEYKGKFWPPFPRPAGKEAKGIHQYHYAHYWPHPQNCEDRSSVHNAMNLQVANGWVDATTLYHYHFDSETGQLNSAGQAQLEYILFRAPAQRRSIYIQISPSAQMDQIRLASVQNSSGAMLQSGSLPPISMRRARAYGTSAEEVDVMSRKYISGAPTPRLPVGGATSGGGAGAGGAGGGGGSAGSE